MSPRLARSTSHRGHAGARARCDARVEIGAESWEDERGDGCLLRCTLRVNGLPMHLEAVAVREMGVGGIVAAVQEDEERLAALDGMYAARWETLSIVPPGRRRIRPFVLYAVPFGE